MRRKRSTLTGSDHFCGCGGSGWGAKKAVDKVGGEILYGANHWKLATESYAASGISREVDCTDLSAADPRRFPYTNFSLWSPECTTHSPAGGNTHKQLKKQMDLFNSNKIDPATERSRATMWDVCRFAEYHKYDFLICENVVEVKTRWVLFDDWLRAMQTLGYNHKCVYLNSMFFFPTPQSRDRIYIVFWKKGNPEPMLDYTPLAFCSHCEGDVYAVQCWKKPDRQYGKYNQQYVYCCYQCANIVAPYYYAAFNCIDWSNIGTRIGDRKKPLSPNTTKRIKFGLTKYGDEPMIVNSQQSTGIDFRIKSISDRLPTISTQANFQLLTPFITKRDYAKQTNVRAVNEVLQTQTTHQDMALVTPWIIEMNSTGECKPASDPTSTFTSRGINHAVLHAPLIVNNKGKSNAKPVTEPAASFTTMNSQGIVTSEAWNSFISCFNGKGVNKPIHESLPTQSTKARMMLINYKKPKLEDCHYRMLKPPEVKKGMGFDNKQVVLGNSKEQICQLGGAVTPSVMEWLTDQCIQTLM